MRPYRVVVWGANGFTGKLVCEHLARNYQNQFNWAMAGRSKDKLLAARDEIAKVDESANGVPIETANLQDSDSLRRLAESCDVMIATVGPYALYGPPVVEACVEAGTHYCDLTGEPLFMREMIDKHHAAAKARGVRIVHCCGFDCVPSEVGALLVADHLRSAHGRSVGEASLVLVDARGGVSGGTLDSAVNMFKQSSSKLKAMAHPYYLVPGRSEEGVDSLPDRGVSVFPVKSVPAGGYFGPFIMAPCNELVVRRSAALLGYGDRMKYHELAGNGSWLAAVGVSAMYLVVGLMLVLASKFAFVRNRLPLAGSGPSRKAMETGFFKIRTTALSDTSDGSKAVKVAASIQDMHRDGGYLSTSRMILEVALCMALQLDDVKADAYAGRLVGGVLTPASATGKVLVDRLRSAGYDIEVHTEGGSLKSE